jgi:hypothetical protein
MSECVICNQRCEPAPTKRGWMSLSTGKGIHDDCLENIWTMYKHQPSPELVRACLAQVEQERDNLAAQLKEVNEDARKLNSVALLAQEYLDGLLVRSAHNRLLTEEITPIIEKINMERELYLLRLSKQNRARIKAGE